MSRSAGLLAVILALLLGHTPAAHGKGDADRPVIVEGRLLDALVGEPIAGLRLFVWRPGGWSPVPYQIDPRVRVARPGGPERLIHLLGAPGRDDPAKTRSLAPDDELVFMAGDLGPAPPAGAAPPASRAGVLIGVGDRGFAGLFAFDRPPPRAAVRYVRYDAVADELTARSYTIGFSRAHPIVFDTLRLHPPSERPRTRAPDILDRVKIRLGGRLLGVLPFRRDESNFRTTTDGLRAGPVRMVRGSVHRLPLAFGLSTPEVLEEQIFFPDGFEFPVWFSRPAVMGRFLSRLSLRVGPDWSPAARGMRVHAAGGAAPFTVDGRMDESERAYDGANASWSVLEGDGVALLSQIIAAGSPRGPVNAPFTLRYRDDLENRDAPEEHPGEMGALAFEFRDLGGLPTGRHRWLIRTRVLHGFTPKDEAAALAALDPITEVRVSPVAEGDSPPLTPPRSGP